MFRLVTARAFQIKEDLNANGARADGGAIIAHMQQSQLNQDQQDLLNATQTLVVTEHERPSTRERASQVFVSVPQLIEKLADADPTRRAGVWAKYGAPYRAKGAPDLALGDMNKLPARQEKPPTPPPPPPKLSEWEKVKLIDDAKKAKLRKKILPAFEQTLETHSLRDMRATFAFPRQALASTSHELRQTRAGFGARSHGDADALAPLNDHLAHSQSAGTAAGCGMFRVLIACV